MSVKVVVDSAADIPVEVEHDHGIVVVPLTVRFADEELVDREELDAEAFWHRVRGSDVIPQTAAPSPGRFESVFRSLFDGGAEAVMCVTLSTRLSATFQAAQVAAAAFPDRRIAVFDSESVSMAEGSLAVHAAARAADGASFPDVLAELAELRSRTRSFGTVDTLEHLRRGGRIGAASALLGSVLSVKPLLELRDGAVESAGKVRTRHRALEQIVARIAERPAEAIWVCHGDAPDIASFEGMLDEAAPGVPRTCGLLGPVVGSHVGPGCVLVAWRVTATT